MAIDARVPYVLGMDSGGTKYLVRAFDLQGRPLGTFRGASCYHYRYPEAEVERRLRENLQRCLESFGGRPEDCRAMVCGTTGLDSPEDEGLLRRLYEGLSGFQCPIWLMNDVELAFRMICGDLGLLILAGTGSICYGKNSHGESARVGGWHSAIFGDEGAGRYIDALALQLYSRWMDGCREDSPLIQEIQRITGVRTRKELMDYAVALSLGQVRAPDLGGMVTETAEAGDLRAREILRDAAMRLVSLAEDAILRLKLEQEERIPIGLWGSVLQHSEPVRETLIRELKNHYPQIEVLTASTDAAEGAARLALAQMNQENADSFVC